MIDIKTIATGSTGNAYLVDDGRSQLLLECGIPFREIRQALNFKTRNLAGCLVTHEHQDHCKGLDDTLAAGIDVYMSKGTADALEIEHHRLNIVQAHEQFQIGSWTILPFDVEHDVAEPIGFLIVNQDGDKLLFATDTYYIRYKFKGLTHIMIECNFSKEILDENILTGRVPQVMRRRLIQSHMSLETLKDMLQANDLSSLQEIHLLHLSDTNSDEQAFKESIQALTGKPVYVP